MNTKEYTNINTYVGEDFDREIKPLAADGWRVIHIWCEPPYVHAFLERDRLNEEWRKEQK